MITFEKRLGIMIGIARKRKLKAGQLDFKQQSFIQTSSIYKFEGIECGSNVCSLATLSRLENGKHNHDFALIDFFLKKLAIQYRVKESLLNQETILLNSIALFYDNSSQKSLETLWHNCELFFTANHQDVLLELDHKALIFIYRVIHKEKVDRQQFEDILAFSSVYHPYINDWFIGCGIWLKHHHPDFWDLNVKNRKFKSHFNMSLRSNNVRTSYPIQFMDYGKNPYQISEGSFSLQTRNFLNYMTKVDHEEKRERLSEAALCLLVVKGEHINSIGSSALFQALCVFNEMNESNRRLNFISETLFDLLSHEPPHKMITKHLSRHVIDLCQHTKTYKPLIRLVELLNENTVNNLI